VGRRRVRFVVEKCTTRLDPTFEHCCSSRCIHRRRPAIPETARLRDMLVRNFPRIPALLVSLGKLGLVSFAEHKLPPWVRGLVVVRALKASLQQRWGWHGGRRFR
jgi:hypothetical protein